MALPGDVTTTTVTFGPYTDAAGAIALVGVTGKLFPVDPSTNKRVRVVHIASGQVVVPEDVKVTIASDGTASAGPIPHTGQATLSPAGFAWRMEWDISSSSRSVSPGNLTFVAPSGTTADFDLLVPAATVPAVAIAQPSVSVVGGVAGNTTAQQLVDALDTPLRAAFGSAADVRLDFRSLPNGSVPTAFDSGQPTYRINNGAGGAAPIVSGGMLTTAPTTTSATAAYLEASVGEETKRIGGTFRFYGAGAGGVATFAVWDTPLHAGFANGVGTIPNAACHTGITPTTWEYGLFESGASLPLARGTFATPLDTTGAVDHRTDITFDGDTAYLQLPDGSVHTVTDSRIATYMGGNPTWEVFQGSGSSSARAAFVQVWADTATPDATRQAPAALTVMQAVAAPPAEQAVTWAPATPQTITATGSSAEINSALRLPFDVPDSLTFIIEATASVYTDGAGALYWEFLIGNPTSGPVIAALLVTNTLPVNGPKPVRVVIPQGAGGYTRVPGERLTLYWRQFITGGVGQVEASGGLGKPATLLVRPVRATVVTTP